MKHYYIHIKSWVYAMSCYGYNKRDAVTRFKKQHGIIRMPAYSIWE